MQASFFSQKRKEVSIKVLHARFRLSMILIFDCLMLVSIIASGEGAIIIRDGNEYIEEFTDHELSVSRPVFKFGIKGAIVSADPPDACSTITGPPVINFSLNWFALIAGNFCDYDTKVLHAAAAGYTAAVIYNVREKEDGSYIHHDDFIANISAVTIRRNSGLIILDNYLYTINPRIRIFIYRNSALSTSTGILLFAIVSGIFIVTFLYFLLVRIFHRRQRFQSGHLSRANIRRLRIRRFKSGDPYETCVICLEDFKIREKLRILPCGHGFHAKCIEPWLLNRSRICPVCKQIVVLVRGISGNSSESDSERRSETAPLLENFVSFGSYRPISNPVNQQS